jgi:hypothetical protein
MSHEVSDPNDNLSLLNERLRHLRTLHRQQVWGDQPAGSVERLRPDGRGDTRAWRPAIFDERWTHIADVASRGELAHPRAR